MHVMRPAAAAAGLEAATSQSETNTQSPGPVELKAARARNAALARVNTRLREQIAQLKRQRMYNDGTTPSTSL